MLGKMAGKAHQFIGKGNRAIHGRIAGIAVSLAHLMLFQLVAMMAPDWCRPACR